MATKDWRKYGIDTWGRKDSYTGFGSLYTQTPGYRIEIRESRGNFIFRKNIRSDFGWNVYKIKSYKTKKQALNYAKNYMRKH